MKNVVPLFVIIIFLCFSCKNASKVNSVDFAETIILTSPLKDNSSNQQLPYDLKSLCFAFEDSLNIGSFCTPIKQLSISRIDLNVPNNRQVEYSFKFGAFVKSIFNINSETSNNEKILNALEKISITPDYTKPSEKTDISILINSIDKESAICIYSDNTKSKKVTIDSIDYPIYSRIEDVQNFISINKAKHINVIYKPILDNLFLDDKKDIDTTVAQVINIPKTVVVETPKVDPPPPPTQQVINDPPPKIEVVKVIEKPSVRNISIRHENSTNIFEWDNIPNAKNIYISIIPTLNAVKNDPDYTFIRVSNIKLNGNETSYSYKAVTTGTLSSKHHIFHLEAVDSDGNKIVDSYINDCQINCEHNQN